MVRLCEIGPLGCLTKGPLTKNLWEALANFVVAQTEEFMSTKKSCAVVLQDVTEQLVTLFYR